MKNETYRDAEVKLRLVDQVKAISMNAVSRNKNKEIFKAERNLEKVYKKITKKIIKAAQNEELSCLIYNPFWFRKSLWSKELRNLLVDKFKTEGFNAYYDRETLYIKWSHDR